ncbi:MAG: 50S ribosomal protein L29 [bacterium]|nr:50S ribosomal protein L29 [bacterium]
MKMNELRQKSTEELAGMIHEKQAHVAQLRMLLRQNKTKNVKEIAAVKKDIARIMTIISMPRISEPV